MKNLHIAIFSTLLSAAFASHAQTNPDSPGAETKAPVDAGAIIMPPKGDQENLNKPPAHAAPKAAAPSQNAKPGSAKKTQERVSGAGKKAAQRTSTKNTSKTASCRGPAELCKQSSAR